MGGFPFLRCLDVIKRRDGVGVPESAASDHEKREKTGEKTLDAAQGICYNKNTSQKGFFFFAPFSLMREAGPSGAGKHRPFCGRSRKVSEQDLNFFR